MSRPLRSRRRADPRARRRTQLASVAALLAGVALGTSALGEESADCAPFDEPYPVVQIARADRGILPADPVGASDGEGGIVTLPDPPVFQPETRSGEVLLALPKDAAGGLPTGTKLGPDARVVESFFSPVLCATIARIVGPEDATPSTLVSEVPATATVVPNSMYFTAQSEVAQSEVAPGAEAGSGPDPYRPLQYAIDQTGVERARAVSDGAGVRVAVLDSAPEAGHRDLAAVRVERFEDGPGEAAAVHGTLVSGVIAATENNGFGMVGVAPGVTLLAIPICTPAGATAADRCTLYDLLRGVDHAFSQGAQIVNLSIVGPANPLLERSMSRLDQLHLLVVASAGNDGSDEPRFPAAYPSVIGVGAANRDRERHPGSNHGASSEILAPGVEILSTVPGSAFAFGSGTSFAAAHVSGMLGILLGAGAEPAVARTALFQEATLAAENQGGPVRLPATCDVLARLEIPCETPSP